MSQPETSKTRSFFRSFFAFCISVLITTHAFAGEYVLNSNGNLAKIVDRLPDGSVKVRFIAKIGPLPTIYGTMTLKPGQFTEDVDSYKGLRANQEVKIKVPREENSTGFKIVKPTAVFPDGRVVFASALGKNGELEVRVLKADEVLPADPSSTALKFHGVPKQESPAPNINLAPTGAYSSVNTAIYDRVAGRLGGKLSLASTASGAIVSLVDEEIDKSVASGQCPILSGRKASFESMMKFDIATVEKVKANCEKEGRDLSFPSYAKEIKSDPKTGFSSVTCTDSGKIKLIHHNGMTSILHFGDASELDSITTAPSDGNSSFQAVYHRTANKTGKWIIDLTAQEGSHRSEFKEPYQSLLNQIYCSRSPCSEDDIHLGIPGEEAVSTELPFGLVTTPVSLAAASDLMHVKNLLTSEKGNPNFNSTCEALGGKAPQDVAFTSELPAEQSTTQTARHAPANAAVVN